MKEIPLTQGKVALVDDEDYERVRQFKWFAARRGDVYYGVRNRRLSDGRWTMEYLHNFILGLSGVDHKDGEGLHNWRDNLRQASRLQNSRALRRKRVGVTSKYRGVCWDRGAQKFQANITVKSHQIFLGRFSDDVEAARVYDTAARKYFGEFASPNFLA